MLAEVGTLWVFTKLLQLIVWGILGLTAIGLIGWQIVKGLM